jgi:phosphotransferase system  glucose/maltose/N-acetylglucosamine-specific IIC component
MSTFVADFINFFNSQVVQNSSGHSVWAILLCLVSVLLNFAFFFSICKKGDSSRSSSDHKEDKK